MRNSLDKRLAALEATHKTQDGVRLPTLAQWRQFNAGDLSSLPAWSVEALQQRREQATQAIAQVLGDFSDE